MTMARTKADEKIQELIKEFLKSDKNSEKDMKVFNEKEFSIFNHETKNPSFLDRYILFPCYITYKKIEKYNNDHKIYENTKKTIQNFKITRYTMYLTDYIDSGFEKKYKNYMDTKNNQLPKIEDENKHINESKNTAKRETSEEKVNIVDQLLSKSKEKRIEDVEKKIGLISNINELNNVTKISNTSDVKNIYTDTKDPDKKYTSVFSGFFALFNSENKNTSKEKRAIGIAALEKNTNKKSKEEDLNICSKEVFLKNESGENKDKNLINNNRLEIVLQKINEKKDEILHNDKNLSENSDFKQKMIDKSKIVNLEKKLEIEINHREKDLNKQIDSLKNKNNNDILIKDLKLNFNSWFYFRFICPDTKKGLRFYQGLKSKDIYVDRSYKDIFDICEKNTFYDAKLSNKRIANFWRIAFSIKPDYVIDFDLPKNRILQKNINKSSIFKEKLNTNTFKNQSIIKIGERFSIFYKLFFLLKPQNFSYRSLGKITLLISFGFLVNIRYNNYKNDINHLNDQNYNVDKYLENKFNIPEEGIFYKDDDKKNIIKVLKNNIFTNEKDDFYLKIMGLEKVLLNYSKIYKTFEFSEKIVTDEELKEQKIKYFYEKNKKAKAILDLLEKNTIKVFDDLLLLTETQNFLNNALKNTFIISYFFYNGVFRSIIKKRILFKYAFGKTLLFSFIASEIAKYMEFFIYIQKCNFASEKILKNNHAEIFRFYFFRENLFLNLKQEKKV